MTVTEIEEMEVGKGLDILIAEKVMGWEVHERYCISGNGLRSWVETSYKSFSPSTDLSAAWEVIDKMYEKEYECSLWMTDDYEGDVCYRFTNANFFKSTDRGDTEEYDGKTAPEAICKAALLTILKESEGK